MRATRSLVGGLLLVLCSASTASAQPPLTCQSNATVPPQIRSAGLSELAGDFVLTCVGTSPVGGITANISVALNTSVTSRLIGAATEALVLIDEPAPGAQTLGTNVFQGVLTAVNILTFSNMPFGVASGGAVSRVVRITNIRANASLLGGRDGAS